MPIFYHMPSIVCMGCILNFVILVFIALFMRFGRFKRNINFILLGLILIIPTIHVTNILLFKLQFLVAKPYIEQAIAQCDDTEAIKVTEDKFITSSTWYWVSEDENIDCGFDFVEWSCRC